MSRWLVLALVTFQALQGDSQPNLYPSVLVARLGGDASFSCWKDYWHSNSSSIVWLINGTSLSSLQLDRRGESIDWRYDSGLRIQNLHIQHNNTSIQCNEYTTTSALESETSTLLLQGLLSAVGSLRINMSENFTVLLTWTAPFTLDLLYVSRDISYYCVDVVNSSSYDLLHSECLITETEYTYVVPTMSPCEGYMFTVTPVNVVGNGTRESILHSWALSAPEIAEISATDYITIVFNALVCGVQLNFLDLNTEETLVIEDSSVTIALSIVTFAKTHLRKNRLYNATIRAFNGAGIAEVQRSISTGLLASGLGYPAVSREIVITNTTPGRPFKASFSLLKSCHIDATQRTIIVECTYSKAIGFQILVQSHDSSQAHILYVDEAVNQSRASVHVEENGLYQVTVFAITKETGITNTSVECMKQVMVNDSIHVIATTSSATTTTAARFELPFLAQVIVMGCLGTLIFLCIALCGIVIIQCCRGAKNKCQTPGQVQEAMDLQLYEEIKPPQTAATSAVNTCTGPTRSTASFPEYEDVMLTVKTSEYKFTQCSAFGVPLK